MVKGSDEVVTMDNCNIPHLAKPNGGSVADQLKLGELVGNSENTEPSKLDSSKDRSTDTIVRKALANVALPSTPKLNTNMPPSPVLSNVDSIPSREQKIQKHFLWRRRRRTTDPGRLDKHQTLGISHSLAGKREQHLVSRFTQPLPPVARIQQLRELREHFSDPLIPDYRLHLVPGAERTVRIETPGNRTTQDLSPAVAPKPTESSHSEARGNAALWITTNLSGCQELWDNPQLPILDTKGATVISSQSKLKGNRKLPLGGQRIIPMRSSSYQVELVRTQASQIQIQNISQTYHHINTDISQKKLGIQDIHRQSSPQAAGLTMNVPNECIDINIKAHHERDPTESASIPTITITGLDPDPQFLRESMHSRVEPRKDGRDKAADRDETPPIPSSQSSERALCDESMAEWEEETLTSSRPTTPQSGSQSSEPAQKIHGIDTTSTGHVTLEVSPPPTTLHIQAGGPSQVPHHCPQNVSVRRALGKLEGLGTAMSPPHHHKASQGQNTEANGRETNDAGLSHHRGSNKVHVADQCQVPTDHKETLIQEAARIAMQRSRAREIVTTRSQTPSPRTRNTRKGIPTIQTLPGPKGKSSSSCGGADIDSSVIRVSSVDGQEKGQDAKQLRLGVKAKGLVEHGKTTEGEKTSGGNTKPSIAVTLVSSFLTLCMIWFGIACAWWVIVKPAFDQRSHLWRRKRRRESTWEDICVFAAAGAFFVVCALVLAGSVRTGFWAVVRI